MACFKKYSYSSCIEVLSMNKKILPSIKDLVFVVSESVCSILQNNAR